MLKIQMIFNELITTCPLSNHIKVITNFVKLGCRTALQRSWPPLKWRLKFAASLFLAATAGMRVALFQSCSISMKTTWNYLFIDTNIDMYVSFVKSVDDVTFRLSLRHLFCPRLRKLWSITKIFRIKIDWNCNFVGLLYHHFWLQLVFALSGQHFQLLKPVCLAKDHWWGFITRNAHMVHSVH